MPRSKRSGSAKNTSAAPAASASGWRRVPNDFVLVDPETGGRAKWNLPPNPRKTRSMLDAEHNARRRKKATAAPVPAPVPTLPTFNRLKHIIGDVPRYADSPEPAAAPERKENISILPNLLVRAQRGRKAHASKRVVKDEPMVIESDLEPETQEANHSLSGPAYHSHRSPSRDPLTPKRRERTHQRRNQLVVKDEPELEPEIPFSRPKQPCTASSRRERTTLVKDEPQLRPSSRKPKRKARTHRNEAPLKDEPLHVSMSDNESEFEMHDALDGTSEVKQERTPEQIKDEPVPYREDAVSNDDADEDAFASANDEPVHSDATQTPTPNVCVGVGGDSPKTPSDIVTPGGGGSGETAREELAVNEVEPIRMDGDYFTQADEDKDVDEDDNEEHEAEAAPEEESITPLSNRSQSSLGSFLISASASESDEGDWTPGSAGASTSNSEASSPGASASLAVENAELRAEVAELRRGMRRLLRQQQRHKQRQNQREREEFEEAFAQLTDDELVPSPRYRPRGRMRDVQSESESEAESKEEEWHDATPPRPAVEDPELNSRIRQLALDDQGIESPARRGSSHASEIMDVDADAGGKVQDEDILVAEEEERTVNSAGDSAATSARTKKKTKKRSGGKRKDETQDWGWRRVENDIGVVDARTSKHDDWRNLRRD